ncbi:NAD-binding protein [bacterium]|nr:NAD-binding protein [bacterium]
MNPQRIRIYHIVKTIHNKIIKHLFKSAVITSGFILLVCSLLLAIEQHISLPGAFLKMLPLLFGELGSIEWESPLARLAATFGLIAGVGFIAIVGASLVSWVVNFSLRGGRIMKRVNCKNHIIICGWNIQGYNIINQLLSPDIKNNRPIVILANLSKRPDIADIVDFISGDPTKEEDLKKAGIMTADTVIILPEFNNNNKNGINPDTQAVLITLAVETLRRDVYTCVQLFSSDYKKHLEHAHVDEYICLDELSGNLMVSSALNHGLSCVLRELLKFSSGSEFYKIALPKIFEGMCFRDVAKILHDERMILFSVETKENIPKIDEDGKEIFNKDGSHKYESVQKYIINPQEKDYPEDYKFKRHDNIFIIAESEPTVKKMNSIANKYQSI